MMQVVEQTHEEKVQMYMKCTKRALAEFLATRDDLDKRLSIAPSYTITTTTIPKYGGQPTFFAGRPD